MKKFILFVAFLLVATSAHAFVQGENGLQNIETVFVTDMGNMTTGDVVVLKTSSPTYPGREVTGTAVANRRIFGVCISDPDSADCKAGTWIRVQTWGYTPVVKVDTQNATTGGGQAVVVGDSLVTSGVMFRAKSNGAGYAESTTAASGTSTTSNTVALSAMTVNQSTGTVTAYIGN